MIVSFAHKGLKQLFEKGATKAVAAEHIKKLLRQLDRLDASTAERDMDMPGWRLHPLKGERKGTWAVDVAGAWRLTFRFVEGNACDVDYEQYH